MIPVGELNITTPLTVEIMVANDVGVGKSGDSDIKYGVSDGTNFIAFLTPDGTHYGSEAPCYGIEGLSGKSFSSSQYEPTLPKPSD